MLLVELATLIDAGTAVACQREPHLWTSERPADRAFASGECAPCPAAAACRAAADELAATWGVWGGIDRAPDRGLAPRGVA